MKEPSEIRLVVGSNPTEPTSHFTFSLEPREPIMGFIPVEQKGWVKIRLVLRKIPSKITRLVHLHP